MGICRGQRVCREHPLGLLYDDPSSFFPDPPNEPTYDPRNDLPQRVTHKPAQMEHIDPHIVSRDQFCHIISRDRQKQEQGDAVPQTPF